MRIITLLLFLLWNMQGFAQNPEQKIQDYLLQNREKLGLNSQDISDFVIESTANSESTGIFNYYVKQRYQGIELFQSLSNFWIKNEEVLSGGENLVGNLVSKINTATPSISVVEGFSAALNLLNESPIANVTILENNGYNYKLSNGNLTNDLVSAELVYQLTENGFLRLAWDYNFYTQDYNHLWSVRVDATDGKLLDKYDMIISCSFGPREDHTNHKRAPIDYTAKLAESFSKNFFKKTEALEVQSGSYLVYPRNIESPNHGSRQLVVAPHNLTASPFGWHDTNGVSGNEFTITRGNNVYAQEDSDADNTTDGASPDGGVGLLFDHPYGGNGVQPTTYTEAATTNLFYMNNIMHDVWYQYGFNEANGSFQVNNYGKGGAGNDAVKADSQDASGTNNANFGTPVDGSAPRMQMFLWNQPPASSLSITSPANISGSYFINNNGFTNGNVPLPVSPAGITQNLILFDNSGTNNPADACSAANNASALNGRIAVIRRGDCPFVEKAIAAQNAGAIAVIIVNNVPGIMGMSGDDANIIIPVVAISQEDGEAIIAAIQAGTVTGKISGPGPFINADGSFDNGIVAHEYGHGISNRLAGGPANSSCLQNAEQMGEGWSDWFWLMMQIKPTDNGTEIKGIGTYATSQATDGVGIRSKAYSTDRAINDFTFADSNTEVVPHGLGSVWATMLWDLTWAYIQKYGFDPNIYTGNGGNNKVMRLVLDGLKLQPCSPTFVSARNALIAADQATTGGQDYCMIWRVFASRGLGTGASSGTGPPPNPGGNSATNQVENFTQPTPGSTPATGSACTTLGIDYFKNSDMIRVFPNPSNGDITVRINQFTGKVNLQVIDLNGRVVYSLNNTDFSIEKSINLNQLQKGMYVIKIDGDNLQYTKKIILN